MFYNMLGASVFLFLISLFQHNEMLSFPSSTWLYLLGMGLVCQLIGWVTINYSLNYLDATKVSVALLSQTVIAGIWAMLLLGEKLEFKEIAGSIVVLAGIAITFLKRRQANIS